MIKAARRNVTYPDGRPIGSNTGNGGAPNSNPNGSATSSNSTNGNSGSGTGSNASSSSSRPSGAVKLLATSSAVSIGLVFVAAFTLL